MVTEPEPGQRDGWGSRQDTWGGVLRMFLSLEDKGIPQRAGQLKGGLGTGCLGSLGHQYLSCVAVVPALHSESRARLHPSQLGKERGQYTSYREPEPWPSEAHSCVHLGQTVPSELLAGPRTLQAFEKLHLRVGLLPGVIHLLCGSSDVSITWDLGGLLPTPITTFPCLPNLKPLWSKLQHKDVYWTFTKRSQQCWFLSLLLNHITPIFLWGHSYNSGVIPEQNPLAWGFTANKWQS